MTRRGQSKKTPPCVGGCIELLNLLGEARAAAIGLRARLSLSNGKRCCAVALRRYRHRRSRILIDSLGCRRDRGLRRDVLRINSHRQHNGGAARRSDGCVHLAV
jgi:hypothetical protein